MQDWSIPQDILDNEIAWIDQIQLQSATPEMSNQVSSPLGAPIYSFFRTLF